MITPTRIVTKKGFKLFLNNDSKEFNIIFRDNGCQYLLQKDNREYNLRAKIAKIKKKNLKLNDH